MHTYLDTRAYRLDTTQSNLHLVGTHLGNLLAKAKLHEQVQLEKSRLGSLFNYFKLLRCARGSVLRTCLHAVRMAVSARTSCFSPTAGRSKQSWPWFRCLLPSSRFTPAPGGRGHLRRTSVTGRTERARPPLSEFPYPRPTSTPHTAAAAAQQSKGPGPRSHDCDRVHPRCASCGARVCVHQGRAALGAVDAVHCTRHGQLPCSTRQGVNNSPRVSLDAASQA